MWVHFARVGPARIDPDGAVHHVADGADLDRAEEAEGRGAADAEREEHEGRGTAEQDALFESLLERRLALLRDQPGNERSPGEDASETKQAADRGKQAGVMQEPPTDQDAQGHQQAQVQSEPFEITELPSHERCSGLIILLNRAIGELALFVDPDAAWLCGLGRAGGTAAGEVVGAEPVDRCACSTPLHVLLGYSPFP
jgi:hypothetical protein